MALRVFGGWAAVMNNESDTCKSTLPIGCPSKIGEQKWYGGLAIGRGWFVTRTDAWPYRARRGVCLKPLRPICNPCRRT
jgi:hypothetical protein